MKKLLRYLFALVTMVTLGTMSVWAETALIAYGNCTLTENSASADGYSTLTGNAGDDAEGFVVKLLNNGKNFSSASKISVPLPSGETGSRTTIKLSNGAQNKVILPEGYIATQVTFYSYINYASTEGTPRTCYWAEVNGVTYTSETTSLLTVFSDAIYDYEEAAFTTDGYSNTMCDAVSFSFDRADKVSEFTFKNTGEQPCVIIGVEYEESVPTAATPTISIADGTVTITTEEEGATIYYTTDGTDPTTESTVYTASFVVELGTTVKAISVKDGYKNSVVASKLYTTFEPVVATFGITREIAAESTTSSDESVTGYALAADALVDPEVEHVTISMNYPSTLSSLTNKGRKIYHGSTTCYVDKGVKNYRNTSTTLGDDYYQFDLVIENGYQINLTQVVSDVCKDANNVQYQVVILNDGVQVYEGSVVSVSKTANALKTTDVSSVDALQGLQGTVSVRMLWTNTGNKGKYVCLKDLNVTGTLEAAPYVEKYAVTIDVDPEGAGTVSQAAEEFEAGKTVVLVATANTGYKFVGWKNESEEILSTDATYEFSMPAEPVNYTASFKVLNKITYSLEGIEGVVGTVPVTSYADDEEITLPVNQTLYKTGYTLIAWNDGTTDYAPGATYPLTGDVTFTPVFTENTVSLADATAAFTVNWTFARDEGAPTLVCEGSETYYVQTATINGTAVDYSMHVNTQTGAGVDGKKGKLNNVSNGDCAQVNVGTVFTIPAVRGMKVYYTATNGTVTTETLALLDEDGNYSVSVSGKVVTLSYTGSAETISIVAIEGNHYPSGLKANYPYQKWETTVSAAAGYSTLYLGQAVTVPTGVTAYYATLNDAKTQLNLIKITDGVIPANTAVILEATGDDYVLNVTTTDVTYPDNVLDGSTKDQATADVAGSTNTVYVLGYENEKVAFYRYTGETLGHHKAYLVIEGASALPAIRFSEEMEDEEDGMQTGLEQVGADAKVVRGIYNMQGQKLNGVGEPGLYIVNGKKVLVK